jgi:hypothetical protein
VAVKKCRKNGGFGGFLMGFNAFFFAIFDAGLYIKALFFWEGFGACEIRNKDYKKSELEEKKQPTSKND